MHSTPILIIIIMMSDGSYPRSEVDPLLPDIGCPIDRRTFLKCLGLGAVAFACPHVIAGKAAGGMQEAPARFYQPVEDGVVRCIQCYRGCMIEPGRAGHCRIRINRDGKLKTLSYGHPGAINIDPVEKKPFSHVLPGSMTYSIAEIGCNIDCKFCQNWQIAHASPGSLRVKPMTPAQIAAEARRNACLSIACTYSEPTVWSEYVLDCAEAAGKNGVSTLVVSNGTWSESVLEELLLRVQAIKVDLKSIEPGYYRDVCCGDLAPVLRNIERIRRSDVWLELVNLVVPTLNDNPESIGKMARWVKTNLGTDVPLHFTRFHPMYKLQQLSPTSEQTLTRAWEAARAEGLRYVYVGNLPSHPGEHTYCPGCGKTVIERRGYRSRLENFREGCCSSCGTRIPGIWSVPPAPPVAATPSM